MTATYSPFFASGLVASTYADSDVLGPAFQPTTPSVEQSQKSLGTLSLSPLTLTSPFSLRSPSTGDVSTPPPSALTPTPRRRRARSSFSATPSVLANIKQSPARESTSIAARNASNFPPSPVFRPRSGSLKLVASFERSEDIPPVPVVPFVSPKRSKGLRRVTVTGPRVSVNRLKRARRGPSALPPPTAPLPPVPSLMQ